MSIGPTIANLFSGAPAPAPVQNAAPTPGNTPAQPTPAMQSDPNNINAPAATTQNQELTGFDKFNDIWKPVESPAGDPNKGLFNVDPKQLMEAAQKVDFSKSINPAHLQAISQGGEPAMAALSQMMNSVSQTVYAQNAMTTAKIVEQAVKQTRESIMKDLPQHIKLQAVNDNLRTENPALNHPAAAPILGALQQQLTVKYPNASATEIAGMAKQYLEGFAGTFAKAPEQNTQSQTKPGETDWTAYLS